MHSFFSRIFGRPRRRHFIAIDIGSNTAVRSIRFEETAEETIAVKKQHFELPFREAEQELIPLVNDELRKLIFQYIREIGRAPDAILIGLGNHFTFNEMTTIARERKTPQSPILQDEIQRMLDEFLEEHRVKIAEGKNYTLVHLLPFRITVDGYPIEALGPKTRGRTLEMALFGTYVEESFWQILFDLRSVLGGLEIRFISDQAAVASALVSVIGIQNALIIKIGARITEVSLLEDAAIRFTGQFENGGNNVTNAVQKRLGVSRNDAERIKRQWGAITLPEATNTALQDAVRLSVAGWVQRLVELLKSDERFLIPERVFLLGGGSRLSAIQDALSSLPWFNELSFLERLDVKVLTAGDISTHLFRNAEPRLSGPEEVALAALAERVSRRHAHTPNELVAP